MVDRIDQALRGTAVPARHHTARLDRERMVVAVITRRIHMRIAGDTERDQVLRQGAAERDIDQLHAATDAQHRLAGLDEGMDQVQFEAIAHRIGGTHQMLWLLPIPMRFHIRTTLQHEAVDQFDQIVDPDLRAPHHAATLHGGQHHAAGTQRHHPMRDRLLHVLQRLVVKTELGGHLVQDARRGADQQRTVAHGRTGSSEEQKSHIVGRTVLHDSSRIVTIRAIRAQQPAPAFECGRWRRRRMPCRRVASRSREPTPLSFARLSRCGRQPELRRPPIRPPANRRAVRFSCDRSSRRPAPCTA